MTMEHSEEPIDLPPSTVPENCQISVQGFESEEAGNTFASAFGHVVTMIGRVIDLERLDGITVSNSYADALANLDRGYEASMRLTPTTGRAEGIAMTPAVIRDDVVKAHMVFDAQIVRNLLSEEDSVVSFVIYTIAHECGHVQDLKYKDTCFPNTILRRRYRDALEGNLLQVVEACWSEYTACRISARYWPEQLRNYEEMFVTSLTTVREQADERIRAHRTHGNYGQVFAEIFGEYGTTMKYAAYLLGHLAGLEADISQAARAQELLEGHWFLPYFERISDALEGLWQRNGAWESLDEFNSIGEIASDLIAEGGIIVSRATSGEIRITVRYPDETPPQS